MDSTCTWSGHEFVIYDPTITNWNDIGGVYVFTCLSQDGFWHALYVGKTESFISRLPYHDRWLEALLRGATHIHARAEELEASRAFLEARLIFEYQPAMNTQLR